MVSPGLIRGTDAAQALTVFAYGSAGDFALQDVTQPAFDLSDRGVEGREVTGPTGWPCPAAPSASRHPWS